MMQINVVNQIIQQLERYFNKTVSLVARAKFGHHKVYELDIDGCRYYIKIGLNRLEKVKLNRENSFCNVVTNKAIDFPIPNYNELIEFENCFVFIHKKIEGEPLINITKDNTILKKLGYYISQLHSKTFTKKNLNDRYNVIIDKISLILKELNLIDGNMVIEFEKKIIRNVFHFSNEELEYGLIHGDISFTNVLIKENNIYFIDYEWSRYDDICGDFAFLFMWLKGTNQDYYPILNEYFKVFGKIKYFEDRVYVYTIYMAVLRLYNARKGNKSNPYLEESTYSLIESYLDNKTIYQWIDEGNHYND